MNTISAKNIYEVLEALKKNHKLWLTSRTISALENFLNGYFLSGHSVIEYKVNQPNFGEFKSWILDKKPVFDGTGNPFSSFLLQECGNNEEQAFDRFFKYLKLFLNERK